MRGRRSLRKGDCDGVMVGSWLLMRKRITKLAFHSLKSCS